jgi:hypothetical protein
VNMNKILYIYVWNRIIKSVKLFKEGRNKKE